MTEIEPTIDNVREGDVVTVEKGTPGELGHRSMTGKWSVDFISYRVDNGWKITRITRPALPIPTEPGERFWARWGSADPHEYVVTDEQSALVMDGSGILLNLDAIRRYCTVVPAPEPETVPVPADLIREAERWRALPIESSDVGVGILTRIVRAVREREGES